MRSGIAAAPRSFYTGKQLQVTGDLVRLTTIVGSRVLPAPLPRSRGRPVRTRLTQQTADFLMPPQASTSALGHLFFVNPDLPGFGTRCWGVAGGTDPGQVARPG
jgi:hypothetical protein